MALEPSRRQSCSPHRNRPLLTATRSLYDILGMGREELDRRFPIAAVGLVQDKDNDLASDSHSTMAPPTNSEEPRTFAGHAEYSLTFARENQGGALSAKNPRYNSASTLGFSPTSSQVLLFSRIATRDVGEISHRLWHALVRRDGRRNMGQLGATLELGAGVLGSEAIAVIELWSLQGNEQRRQPGMICLGPMASYRPFWRLRSLGSDGVRLSNRTGTVLRRIAALPVSGTRRN